VSAVGATASASATLAQPATRSKLEAFTASRIPPRPASPVWDHGAVGVLDRLSLELADCCADAGLEPASFVVFVVDARRPPGTTPIAYLQPAGVVAPDTVLVFRAAGAGRVAAHHLAAHRLALWRELPGIPEAALGPMIRHELEHARRFERSGPRFFEADDLLRAAVRRRGGSGYSRLPSEREANAASAAYARRTLQPGELAAVRASPECADLLSAVAAPGDVVEATLAELAALQAPAGGGEAALAAAIAELREACAAWALRPVLELGVGRSRAAVELVTPSALAS